MTDLDTRHFKKRQKQLTLILLAIAIAILATAGVMFQADLADARNAQRWGLWRDDHCTRVDAAASDTATSSSIYTPSMLKGVPGTWACDDGATYTLHNSDVPPEGWVASEHSPK